MKPLVERTEAWIAEERGAGWLPCSASADAVARLLENWREAKRDGTSNAALLNDIEQVIERLRAFQKEMKA